MKLGHVKCDKCGWRIDDLSFKEIAAWHKKLCPKCNDSEIITDEEKVWLDAIVEMECAGLVTQADDESPAGWLTISIDTAPLRKPEAA